MPVLGAIIGLGNACKAVRIGTKVEMIYGVVYFRRPPILRI
jgi:hypothetical protein